MPKPDGTPLDPLPPSSDKEFWGDAEVVQVAKQEPKTPHHHHFVQKGAELVCDSCPFQHTMSKVVD